MARFNKNLCINAGYVAKLVDSKLFCKMNCQGIVVTKNTLRINVGFIIHESIGYHHEFQFDIESVGFLKDYIATDLLGSIGFDRTQKGLIAEGNFKAEVINECSRCLETFSQSINFSFTELYAFREKDMTEEQLLVPESGYIEMEPLIRDFMLLNISDNSLCKEGCKGLCKICGTNKNDATCKCEEDVIDPRLAKLQDLLNKDD